MVIPVRDEGGRLARFLEDLAEAPTAPATSFVVVDDGSTPSMRELHARAVEAFARRMRDAGHRHQIRLVVAAASGGKGSAIRLGWGDGAEADWLGFVDGDGAVPAREVWRLATALAVDSPFDALLGSRSPAPGRTVTRRALRGLQGRVFARVANGLLGLAVGDPQCGLKFFRAERLLPHLGALRERGWTLDPEILVLLRNDRSRFREEGIDWTEHGASKTIFGIDAARMLWQVLRIRRRVGTARRP